MRVRAGRRTCLEQKQPVEARLSCGAGLTGRYFGGQATQQEQRFDARGEDPDQFAGWFEQIVRDSPHLRLFARLCELMSGNHRGDRSLFSVRLRKMQTRIEGFVRSELTFSLVLTAAMLLERGGCCKRLFESQPPQRSGLIAQDAWRALARRGYRGWPIDTFSAASGELSPLQRWLIANGI